MINLRPRVGTTPHTQKTRARISCIDRAMPHTQNQKMKRKKQHQLITRHDYASHSSSTSRIAVANVQRNAIRSECECDCDCESACVSAVETHVWKYAAHNATRCIRRTYGQTDADQKHFVFNSILYVRARLRARIDELLRFVVEHANSRTHM